MIKKLIEHREYQQLRKDQRNEKKMKQAGILLLVGLTLLLAVGAMEKLYPESKPVAAVPAPVTASTPASSEAEDIEHFATVVTQPLETLSTEDLDFVGSKAGDPCYENNASLPPEEMIEVITACKASQ
jgi:hypothetical protein